MSLIVYLAAINNGCRRDGRRIGVPAGAARADRPCSRRSTSATSVTSGAHRRSVTSRRLPKRRAHARGRARSWCSRRIRERPFFRPIVDAQRARCSATIPTRSYYTAPVRDDMTYRVTGQPRRRRLPLVHGRDWDRKTAATARRPRACCATATSTSRPTAASRSSSAVPSAPRTGSRCPSGASELIVRCYFEEAEPAAADPNRRVPLTIEPIAWRTGRSAGSVGRRVGRGGVSARRSPSSATARSSSRSPANANSRRGCRATPNEFPQPELPGRLRLRGVRRGVLDGAVRARRPTRRS